MSHEKNMKINDMIKIGISTSLRKNENEDDVIGTDIYILDYILKNNLGMPLLIPINCSEDQLKEYVELIDVLILPGGFEEIKQYDLENLKQSEIIDRNVTEFLLIKEALKQNKNILGICRGMQLLNIFFGGTLKSVENHCFIDNNTLHSVNNFGIFTDIFLENKMLVNSYHYQAIDTLGENCEVLCVSDDSIIEGIQIKNNENLLLGVQFHPEINKENYNFNSIIDFFVDKFYFERINKEIEKIEKQIEEKEKQIENREKQIQDTKKQIQDKYR